MTSPAPRRSPRGPVEYLFTPVPDALVFDQRAADAVRTWWMYVHRISKRTNAVEISWRELAEQCGRDRQWVKSWGHKAHNLGWATITEAPGGVNLIVLHEDREIHVAYRQVAGGDREFFTHTDHATPSARAERAQNRPTPGIISSAPWTRMRNHQVPDEKSSALPPAETGCSTTRAYARTRETRAHETPQCNAGGGGSVEQAEEPVEPSVKLARGTRPAARPVKRRERPMPPRPQIDPRLQELRRELSRAKIAVRWHGMDSIETGMVLELLDDLGAEQMAWIASKTTAAAVAAGKQPAHHVRAYLGTWAQHAPVVGFGDRQELPVISAKCTVHPAMSNPCELCVAARNLPARSDFLQAPGLDEPDPEDTAEGAEFVASLRRKREVAAAEGRRVGAPSHYEVRRLDNAGAVAYDPAPLLIREPTEAERLVDLGGWSQ
ncbi:hypothetical protein [Streptomyces sp. NBC_01264]|uniref:hypothetical protein n=1 Tax=Streptomyces sp. NBC_01264 TaxID=2903804 RepID=UPI00225C279B|nr:hypothetical protein [Streptomyces sp. NBC_01264]MCX4783319.1 hypothetical protein [Streptomyces sp. NBC_01264]